MYLKQLSTVISLIVVSIYSVLVNAATQVGLVFEFLVIIVSRAMSQQNAERLRKRRRRVSNKSSSQFMSMPQSSRSRSQEIELDLEDLQQDVANLDSKEQSTERKVELLAAIVSKQNSVIMNLKDNVLNLSKRSLQNEFAILNLREVHKEDLLQSVIYALNSIGITQDIDFEATYRRGPPRTGSDSTPRPVIVRLHRRDVVDKILTKA